ncbi:MAG: acyl transferase, partial [Sphingobacteriaceae bacterium]|nr:acyl transferase [Cytophagaceae bacterium]
RDPARVTHYSQVPFLPIEFFKTQRVLSGTPAVALSFESSGTTGQLPSRHFVADPLFYETLSQRLFEQCYGSLRGYTILALLPSYLERGTSSLVHMVRHFIEQSGTPESGFFLNNTADLRQQLLKIRDQKPESRILLIGVTFALLDLADSGDDWSFLGELPRLVVMETGGMKGRRRELLREEVHYILTQAFGVARIHSEYGMTELLSQAYSAGEGIFEVPPSMRILLRDVNDPFAPLPPGGRSGGINIVDLGNVDSCAFVETKDLGDHINENGFRVLGRFDNSDVRGCNLMVV